MTRHLSPEELARAAAEAMWENDRATRNLGMTLDDIGPGRSKFSLTVTEDMTNGHGTCHGGFIFALADTAFAFACNSYNQRTVAHMAAITFLAPGLPGMRLVAEAREIFRQGRNGIYDISVRDQDGTHIAEFRGHSRTVKGTHLPTPTE
jgi:acyl-CoA thioesterase